MKIIINYLGRNNSGPYFSFSIAKALHSIGYCVYPIISKYTTNIEEWREYGFERLYEVETYQSKEDLISKSIRFEVHEKNKIREYYSDLEIDFVIKTFFHPWANEIDRIFPNARVIAYCHDPILHEGAGFLMKTLYPFFIKNSSDIVVLTKSFIPVVQDKYGKQRSSIYLSRHGRLDTYKDKMCLNRPIDIPSYDQDKTNYLFFGRIEPYKGLDVLANAYKMVCKENDCVTLTIAGAGDFTPYMSYYQGLNNVTIINRYFSDDEVGWLFDGGNVVLVLPYASATQSGVVTIALEYGVPIVATKVGGLNEQLDDGSIGVFCIPSDKDDLARAMKTYINNPQKIIHEKEKMKRFLEQLDWNIIIKQLFNEIEMNLE